VEAHTYGPVQASGEVSIVIAGVVTEQPSLVLAQSIQIPVNVREEFTSNDWQGSGSMGVNGRMYEVKGPRLYLMNIFLEPVDEFSEQGASLRPPTSPNDKSLVFGNVSPGRYWVRNPRPMRGYVQSISSDGVDLLHEPLVVTSGSHSPIEVVMRDDTAELEGSVAGVNAAAAQGGAGLSNGLRPADSGTPTFVYCVPQPDSGGQFEQFGVSPDGTFHSPPIAPGSYRVLAFARQQPNLPYRDPQAMRAYETQGQVVHLVAGQKEHLQLQLISVE
jgi:hypothetical protein